jgi:hypothetical protein
MVRRARIARPRITRYLLSTERDETWEADLARLRIAIDPRNSLEDIYADDFVACDVEQDRVRQAAAAAIERELSMVALDVLTGQCGILRGEAIALIQRWRRGESDAKAKLLDILHHHGRSERDLQAGAYIRALAILRECEQLTSSISSRRDRLVAALEFVREAKVRRQREVVTQVMDRAVGRIENRSAQMPASRTEVNNGQ